MKPLQILGIVMMGWALAPTPDDAVAAAAGAAAGSAIAPGAGTVAGAAAGAAIKDVGLFMLGFLIFLAGTFVKG